MSKKRYHVIATVYDRRGNILSIGTNSYTKTHPVQAKFAAMFGRGEQIYLHAEIAAITKLPQPWKAHRIKVERYDSDGNPVCCKPCVICSAVIASTNIKRIEHT